MEISIREANLEDVSSIAEIHVTSWQATYRGLIPEEYILSQTLERRTKLWTNVITDKLADLLVAEYDGDLAGFISWNKPELKATADITSLYLFPHHISKGIGSRLLAECEARLIQLHVSKATLWVLDSNVQALNFYQKHQFVQTGKQGKNRINGLLLNDLELEKSL